MNAPALSDVAPGVKATDQATLLPIASDKEARGEFMRLLRSDPRMLTKVAITGVLGAMLPAMGPWSLGKIIEQFESGSPDLQRIVMLCTVGVVATVFGVLSNYLNLRMVWEWAESMSLQLRGRLISSVFAMSMKAVERTPAADLTTRVTADTNAVRRGLTYFLDAVFAATFNMVICWAAALWIAPQLAIVLIIAPIGLVSIGRWYLKRSDAAYLIERTLDARLADVVSETVMGARTLEALSLGEHRQHLVDSRIAEVHRSRMRTLWLRTVMFFSGEAITRSTYALALGFGGYLVITDHLTLGAVVAASLLVLSGSESLFWTLEVIELIQDSVASLRRILGVSKSPKSPEPTTQQPVSDELVMKGVRYRYGPGLPDALRGIDLAVSPGERLALVGPSGAGKTTIGRLLAGFDAPTEGEVLVGGVPIHQLSTDELATRVMMVTQDHHIFIGTVKENVVLAAPDASDDQVRVALESVGVNLSLLPEGIHTVVGVGGWETDGALAQQIALARVIIAAPHTVILDEATSLLSPANARHAENDLSTSLEGRTVIAIAHRLYTAYDADRIAVVDDGRIIELGSHAELLAQNGSYAALWRTWHGDAQDQAPPTTGWVPQS